MPIPVYAFTGFLESGKTKFIQETLEDPRFNGGERTLLLVCEEGEEEYDPTSYPHDCVYQEVIDDLDDLCGVYGLCSGLCTKAHRERSPLRFDAYGL